MIKTRNLHAVIGILAIHFFSANSLIAQDNPVELFEQCQDELNALSLTCIQANNQTANGCINVVELLLEQGHFEAAAFVASNCIWVIHHRTQHCRYAIFRLCRQCVHQLHALGATELAYLFMQNCEDTVALLQFTSQNSIQSIQDLFDDKG